MSVETVALTARELAVDEQLAAYAAGNAAEPMSMLIATQMHLSPQTVRQVRKFEAVGGALLENLPAAEISDDLLAATFARIDHHDRTDQTGDRGKRAPSPLPEEVLACLEGDIDALPWARMSKGLAKIPMLADRDDFDTRLLRIEAGKAMPYHTHAGNEFTLVLRGGFSDAAGHYGGGQLAVADASVEHAPIADADGDCICLAVTDGPLRLTRGVGRWLNWAVRY